MSHGKKVPLDQRAQAVGIAFIAGDTEASRITGHSRTAILGWRHSGEFDELRRRTKAQVDEEWWAGIQRGFRVVIDGFDGPEPIQQKATAAAILFDKWALMRGEPTSIERLNLIEGMDDHERTVLSEAIRGELARRANPDAAEDAVGATGPTGSETPTW